MKLYDQHRDRAKTAKRNFDHSPALRRARPARFRRWLCHARGRIDRRLSLTSFFRGKLAACPFGSLQHNHIDSEHIPRCPWCHQPRRRCNLEQTINGEVYEPADASQAAPSAPALGMALLGNALHPESTASKRVLPSDASAVAIRRECVAQCWPLVLPRGRCECLVEVFASPPCFSTDQ
jgi:hypothetical protein